MEAGNQILTLAFYLVRVFESAMCMCHHIIYGKIL